MYSNKSHLDVLVLAGIPSFKNWRNRISLEQILLPTCICGQQLAYSDYVKDANYTSPLLTSSYRMSIAYTAYKHICVAVTITTSLQCFDCWMGGRKGNRPVKNLSGGVLAWLSVWSKMQTCIWPSWCHCHSLSLASVKSRLVLPFWYRLTQVVPEKGPLNGCVCVLL